MKSWNGVCSECGFVGCVCKPKREPLTARPKSSGSTIPPKAGDRIKFIKTLTSGPDEDGPGNHYATKGDLGTIDRVGGCWEGYMVFWDKWKSASFGAQLGIDFEMASNEIGQTETKEIGKC